MNSLTDQQLLGDYVQNRSEAAFAELVRRHIDLVHSSAVRMTGEPHSAQDVTQAVFVTLAQNAGGLVRHPVLSGWLHTTARNLAAKAVRTAVRRQQREQEAVAMNELLSSTSDAPWEQIAPHLDAALGELTEPDRDALLLRYFEKKSAAEIGSTLGISSEAAQKRISRAVERLREFFAKRGVSVGAGGLIVVISANAVQAAPVGLAVTISAAALAGTAVTTSPLIAATTKTIAMTTLQKTLVTATVAVLAGAGIYEARQAAQLRAENQTLQQQQAPLVDHIQKLEANFSDATNREADLLAENLGLKSNRNQNELLKLRGEVGSLRQENANLKTSLQTLRNPQSTGLQTYPTNIVPRDAWGFAGYNTPAAAVQSMIWAKSIGDFQAFLNSVTPKITNDVMNGYQTAQSPEQAATKLLQETKGMKSLQIIGEIPLDESTVIVQTTFEVEPLGGTPKYDTLQMVLKKINGEWKYSNEFVPRH